MSSLKNIIRIQSNKSQFQAYIFSLPEVLASDHKRFDQLGFVAKREILSCLPLFVEIILVSGDRWFIGKIRKADNPYDIFFAPERLVERVGRNAKIYTAAYVQVKNLILHPIKNLSAEGWISHLQSKIDEYCNTQRAGRGGLLHFYNEINLDVVMRISEITTLLGTLKVPKLKTLHGITLTSSAHAPDEERSTLITWIIYPRVAVMGDYVESLERVKYIYRNSPKKRVKYRIDLGDSRIMQSHFGLDFSKSGVAEN